MLVTLLLFACTGPKDSGPVDTDSAATEGPDPDADGFLPPEDCDDHNAAVYPGAEDPNGDGLDADCDGNDGDPYLGCSPIDVPDVYATIEAAANAGEASICLGDGEFTPGPLDEGVRISSLRGQGRDKTFVTDPSAHGAVGVLDGLTATGVVVTEGNAYFTAVTLVDATITGFDNFSCERCALIRSTVDMYNYEAFAGIVLLNSWVSEGNPAIHLTTEGCLDSTCGFYCDVRVNNVTYSGNTVVYDMDLTGRYNVYLGVENSIFVDNTEALLKVDYHSSGPRVNPSGNGNLQWNNGADPFPDGVQFSANEKDPELEMNFSPPRPGPASPALDSAGTEASTVDFWGHKRIDADKGAVER